MNCSDRRETAAAARTVLAMAVAALLLAMGGIAAPASADALDAAKPELGLPPRFPHIKPGLAQQLCLLLQMEAQLLVHLSVRPSSPWQKG